MTDSEAKIYQYLSNYFTSNELQIMKKYYIHDYNHDDTFFNDPEYLQLTKLYKSLLNIADEGKYRIEVDESGRALIKKLFERYVTTDTLVITTVEEHFSVTNEINKLNPKNVFKICIGGEEHLSNKLIEEILAKYNSSNCKNIFIFLPGVVPGFSIVLNQTLLCNIKTALIKNNIPHIFVLDDCQGILNIKRDYDIFDAILISTHVLFLGFDMGILFTKLNKKIGFVNKTGLKRFAEKLEILSNHRDKANQFNTLLTEYFNPILNDSFVKKIDTAPQYFTLTLNNIKNQAKYTKELYTKYRITINEVNAPVSWLRIRLHEALIQNPNHFLEGLRKTTQILNKLEMQKNLISENQNKIEQYFEYNDLDIKEIYDMENEFYNFKTPQEIIQAKHIIMSQILGFNRSR